MRSPHVAALLALGTLALALPVGAATTAQRGRVLPFIADDYEKAVAEARARKVPLFIEAWAPW